MKKLVGLMAVTALAVSAFAQGTVVFNNNASGWLQQWTSPANNTLIHMPVSGGSVELFAAPTGTALNPLVSYVGGLPANGAIVNYGSLELWEAANPGWAAVATTGPTTIAGLINGGSVTIANIAAGANAEYIVVGWTGSSANFDAALAANVLYGESALLTTGTGNPTATPPGTATPLSGTFTGITMAPIIPEPTSFALAGLGLAALLVFRRRS